MRRCDCCGKDTILSNQWVLLVFNKQTGGIQLYALQPGVDEGWDTLVYSLFDICSQACVLTQIGMLLRSIGDVQCYSKTRGAKTIRLEKTGFRDT